MCQNNQVFNFIIITLKFKQMKKGIKSKLSKRKLFMFLWIITASVVSAQNITVTGTVRDVQNESLMGVTIQVQNTINGTITDLNGNFTLSNVPPNGTLEVSYVGMKTQMVNVNGRTTINLILEEDSEVLDELVVVSYGTQKKRDVTGSIQTVSGDDLSDLPVSQIGQKLQGKVAGVQINQSSGIPGQGIGFRIRGSASINNSSQPLFVVDGLPISTGLNNINPDEIESFSILKDAAATSLYGSRAANGVILITTKKGKLGKTNVTFNANYGIQTLANQKEMDIMNGSEFAQFKKEYYEDAAKYEGYTGGVPEVYQNPEKYGNGTDWYKELIRSAPIQNYSLSLSTGKDNFTSAVFLNYFHQEGVIKNSDFQRISLRSNNDYQVNDYIKLGLNVAPVMQLFNNQNTDGDRQILSAAMIADPSLSPYDENGDLTVALVSPGMFPQPNWIRYLDERYNNHRIFTLLSNAFAEVNIIDGLKYRFQTGVDIGNRRQRVWTPSTAGGGLFTAPPVKANANYNTAIYYNWTLENTLSYDKTFGEHTFGGLIGYTSQKYNYEWGNLSGTDFPDDDISWIDAAATKNGGSGVTEWSISSILGRLNYSFKNRYLFQANIRRDGSSRFGSGNKYATFPSFSGGWIVSEENFMESLSSTLNYLKLRASWGVTGNFNIGDYAYIASLGKRDYVFGGTLASGKALNGIGNNELTWEETSQFDIGVDIGLFNDRIFLMYDYYKKKTEGMLYAIDIPWSTGFSNIAANVGNFNTWGHEFSLETRNLVGDFKWKTNFNITFNRNKVLKLSTNDTPIGGYGNQLDWNRLEVGEPIGIIMGYVYDGVYMTQQEFDSQPKHASSEIGTVRMKDISGPEGIPDGIIDNNDRTKIGNPNPNFLFGMTNDFAWKNFDLSVLINGSVGGDIFLGAYENTLNLDGVFNVLKTVKDRWRSLENPGKGVVPRTKAGTTELYRFNHSGWIYDGSYLTVKNITLGYTLPINQNQLINKVRLYLSGQQLFTFTKYPGLNPEVSDNNSLSWRGLGVDRTTYPIPKTFTIGCNITF